MEKVPGPAQQKHGDHLCRGFLREDQEALSRSFVKKKIQRSEEQYVGFMLLLLCLEAKMRCGASQSYRSWCVCTSLFSEASAVILHAHKNLWTARISVTYRRLSRRQLNLELPNASSDKDIHRQASAYLLRPCVAQLANRMPPNCHALRSHCGAAAVPTVEPQIESLRGPAECAGRLSLFPGPESVGVLGVLDR